MRGTAFAASIPTGVASGGGRRSAALYLLTRQVEDRLLPLKQTVLHRLQIR